MPQDSDPLDALREALRVSPNNVPLRKHLAESLSAQGRLEESECEYLDALKLAPQDLDLKLGLVECYYQQGKNGPALVIVEDLVGRRDVDPRVLLWHARLAYRAGDIRLAVAQYKEAVDLDPDLTDEELQQRLGISADSMDEIEDGRVRARWEDDAPEPTTEIDRPKIDFSHVGGMEALKEEIRLKIIYPLRNPEVYRAYGKSIGGGILMYGPPGCGKTFLARATAGETQSGFMSIGISQVLDMWIGSSERNLHEIFQQARQNQPCVLFFDEVDALGASRSDMRQSAGRHLINQFLSEMDGANASNEGVLILGATNAPWHLDSAFRRPGRFDRIVFVPPPDQPARAEVLRLLCRDKPISQVDFSSVAAKTKDFSGADLEGVINQAVEGKLQQAIRTGKPEPLTTKDLLRAAKTIKPSTREWFSTARNYALYSNQGGVYDDILNYLGLK